MSDMSAKEAGVLLGGVHPQTVMRKARALGVGMNWHGSIGWRFTLADVDKIRDAQRVKPAPTRQRRRRAS